MRQETEKRRKKSAKRQKKTITREDNPPPSPKPSRKDAKQLRTVAPTQDEDKERERKQTTTRKKPAKKATPRKTTQTETKDKDKATPPTLQNLPKLPALPTVGATPQPTVSPSRRRKDSKPTASPAEATPVARNEEKKDKEPAKVAPPAAITPPAISPRRTPQQKSARGGVAESPKAARASKREPVRSKREPVRVSRREPVVDRTKSVCGGKRPCTTTATTTTSAATSENNTSKQPTRKSEAANAANNNNNNQLMKSVFLTGPEGTTSVTMRQEEAGTKKPESVALSDVDDEQKDQPEETAPNSCESSKQRKLLTPQSAQHVMNINVIHDGNTKAEMKLRSFADEPNVAIVKEKDPETNVEANRCLKEFAEMASKLSMHALSKEFSQKIRTIRPFDAQCKTYKAFENKNRYDDIFCLDETRVMLCDQENRPLPANENYIHANYVSSAELSHRFVVTQAPMRNTVVDFWHMIWQLQSPLIVMLCDYVENDKSKCFRYLPPNNESKQHRHVTVRTLSNMKHAQGSLIETRLKLSSTTGNLRPLEVRHFRYIGWPDHGVPKDFQTIFRLLKDARTSYGTTVVHCSAGIGRSGTFISLEFCLGVLRNGKQLDVKACVENLRRQRAQCVQTAHQYLFIYRALLELADVNELVDHKQFKAFCNSYERATRVKTTVLK